MLTRTKLDNIVPREKAAAMADRALADLAARLDAGHSEALDAYLRLLGRFHRYSATNALLIRLQSPDATHVAGYGKWRELGRQVRRGERGIAILAPCVHRRDGEGEGADRRDSHAPDPAAPSRETVLGFRTAYVFDVAQTEGDALPSFPEVSGDPGYQLGALRSLVRESGIGLAYAESLGGARGLSAGGRIALLRGMRPAEEFCVLVHEYAHELLHRGERRARTTVGERELEAEAVAYVVASAVGLEAGTASSDYIQLHRGDSGALARSLSRVQRVACEVLEYLL